jgi:glycosyltransferase involved in cell wall biosynthesis
VNRKAGILHVLTTGHESAKGIAHTVMNLSHALDRTRFTLSVLFLREAGPIAEEFRNAGVDSTVVRWRGTLSDVAGSARFAAAVRASRCDIVHLHAGGLAPRILVRTVSNARVVAHYHSLLEETPVRTRRPRSAKLADMVIVNSDATAKTILGASPIVIRPGVTVPKDPSNTMDVAERCRIGVASRLVPVKGIRDLIAAIAQMNSEGTLVDLEIAGSGADEKSLRQYAVELGVADRVFFAGWVADPFDAMRHWSVYAQPSHAEGLGISVLEAMAAGLPVVATAVGGIPEVVIEGETGFLVPPGDVVSLAESLTRLVRKRELRATMGMQGRARVLSLFTPEREAAQIMSAYDGLLA